MPPSAQEAKRDIARAAAQTHADAPTKGTIADVNRRSTAAEAIPDEGTQEDGTDAMAAPRPDSAIPALATATTDRTPATAPDHHSADASNRETVTQAAHRRATTADAPTAAIPRTTGEAATTATTADAIGATAGIPPPYRRRSSSANVSFDDAKKKDAHKDRKTREKSKSPKRD